MKPRAKLRGRALPAILGLLAAAALVAAPPARPDGPERTLFRDIPEQDPVRAIVGAVLASRSYSLRDRFTADEWSAGGYGAAWDRARGYFPGRTYFVRPGIYFMTHGADADGRLFMEIHESPYLALCLENRRTFGPGSIVAEYGRMLAAANGREAAAFREKMGRLEAACRDEKAHGDLRRALGGPLYDRLIRALREEDYHMLAGGLMHEGMHAGLDEKQAARLQADFKAGSLAAQWDEMRAFAAEIGYHGRFCGPAAAGIEAEWRSLAGLLDDLEAYRRRASLPAGPASGRFDRIKARACACAAIIRLRAREIWQSARRMQDLATGLARDYVSPTGAADLTALAAKVGDEAAGFAGTAAESIQATELALRSVEQVLDTWETWAEGRRPFPPPVTDSRKAVERGRSVVWPAPNTGAAAAVMRRAGQEIAKDRPSS